jgi:hypothetical protein
VGERMRLTLIVYLFASRIADRFFPQAYKKQNPVSPAKSHLCGRNASSKRFRGSGLLRGQFVPANSNRTRL